MRSVLEAGALASALSSRIALNLCLAFLPEAIYAISYGCAIVRSKRGPYSKWKVGAGGGARGGSYAKF